MSQYSFPKRYRIRLARDFKRVYENRQAKRDSILKVFIVANDLELTRLGMAVSKRNGNAVRRNRIKRLFREAFRLLRPELPAGWDLVMVPQFARDRKIPSLEQFQASLVKLVTKLTQPKPTSQSQDPPAKDPS